LRQVECSHGKGAADTSATGVLVDHDILNPGPQSGREGEGDQGQHASDGAVAPGDEQGGGLVTDDPDQVVGVQWRGRAGEL
jgi:hypothetical protein